MYRNTTHNKEFAQTASQVSGTATWQQDAAMNIGHITALWEVGGVPRHVCTVV